MKWVLVYLAIIIILSLGFYEHLSKKAFLEAVEETCSDFNMTYWYHDEFDIYCYKANNLSLDIKRISYNSD